MPESQAESALVKQIAEELNDCRQRGLADLDMSSHKQPAVAAPTLGLLAHDYCVAQEIAVFGRIAEIRALLSDALPAYKEQGNEREARFIAVLFFGDGDADDGQRPKARLDAVKRAAGYKPDRFDDFRRAMFRRFAAFLIAFVAAVAPESAGLQPIVPAATESGAQPSGWRRWSLPPVSVPIIAVVLAGALLLPLLLAVSHGASRSLSPAATASVAASPTSPPYVAGKTYPETAGQFGSPTFTDPHNPSVTGPRLSPYQQIQVSCKVFAPTIPSIMPDGYWYRIASPLEADKYFTPAANFVNGDQAIGGPRLHYTDFAVPDCPV